MKNWRTTLIGILGAGLVLATSKGWIDQDIATFIGTALIAVFGVVSKDYNSTGIPQSFIGGTKPPVDKDEK